MKPSKFIKRKLSIEEKTIINFCSFILILSVLLLISSIIIRNDYVPREVSCCTESSLSYFEDNYRLRPLFYWFSYIISIIGIVISIGTVIAFEKEDK